MSEFIDSKEIKSMVDWKEISQLWAEKLHRVRELHKPVKSLFGFQICEVCLKDFPTEYPSTYSVVPFL